MLSIIDILEALSCRFLGCAKAVKTVQETESEIRSTLMLKRKFHKLIAFMNKASRQNYDCDKFGRSATYKRKLQYASRISFQNPLSQPEHPNQHWQMHSLTAPAVLPSFTLNAGRAAMIHSTKRSCSFTVRSVTSFLTKQSPRSRTLQ